MEDFLKAIRALVINNKLDDQRDVLEMISVYSLKIDENIRKNNCETYSLIRILAFTIHQEAINLYGNQDAEVRYEFDIDLRDHPRSNLACNGNDKSHLIICLGRYISTWWDLLYDIAHETIHSLHKFVSAGEEYCTLDEGVAVKFAEMILEKYIKPFGGVVGDNISPQNSIYKNKYYYAYEITLKIPNEILKKIREELGSFSEITDFEIFYLMTSMYITKNEALLLYQPFNNQNYRNLVNNFSLIG